MLNSGFIKSTGFTKDLHSSVFKLSGYLIRVFSGFTSHVDREIYLWCSHSVFQWRSLITALSCR